MCKVGSRRCERSSPSSVPCPLPSCGETREMNRHLLSPQMSKACELLPPDMPRLGMGCGDLCGGAGQSHSAKLVRTAYDAGIRYFDVARLYGNGSAEGVLGNALKPMRDRVI